MFTNCLEAAGIWFLLSQVFNNSALSSADGPEGSHMLK